MTLFPNIALTVKRYQLAVDASTVGGHYERGKWNQGDASVPSITIMASVQPSSGDVMKTFAEGRRVAAMYTCYTDTPVYTTDPVKGSIRDEIIWQGQTYEVVHVAPWLNGIISHYMFVMLRENEIPAPQPPYVG